MKKEPTDHFGGPIKASTKGQRKRIQKRRQYHAQNQASNLQEQTVLRRRFGVSKIQKLVDLTHEIFDSGAKKK